MSKDPTEQKDDAENDWPLTIENLPKLRRQIDATLDPEWLAKYGEQSWRAALTVLGVDPDSVSFDDPAPDAPPADPDPDAR
jgi:hypothetical protein